MKNFKQFNLERLTEQADLCLSQLYKVGDNKYNEMTYFSCFNKVVSIMQEQGYEHIPKIMILQLGKYHEYRMKSKTDKPLVKEYLTLNDLRDFNHSDLIEGNTIHKGVFE